MIKKSEDEIISRAKKWNKKSKEIKKLCLQFNIKFIDVSYNRNDIFEKLIEELFVDE